MGFVSTDNLKSLLYICALCIILVFSFVWRQRVLDVFAYEYDEGIHLVLAQVLSAGYEPYREVFVSYPPLFAWSLGFPYLLLHTTDAVQLLMALYSILGVVAVAYLATSYFGRLSGLAAAILVSFSPGYFIPSRAAMGEVPSVGLAALGVALTEHYRRRGGWYWALLAGIALSASISMKVLPIFAPVLLGLIILSRYLSFKGINNLISSFKENYRLLLRDAALSVLGFTTFLIWPVLFFYDLPSFYDQVIGMRFASREVFSEERFVTSTQLIVDFLSDNPAIIVLSMYGITFVGLKRVRHYGFLFVWLILTWATLIVHIPLRYKHLPLLIPPLAVWGGAAVQYMVGWLIKRDWSVLNLKVLAVLGATILSIAVLWVSIPEVIAENQGQNFVVERKAGRRNAITRANVLTAPRDCVVSDDPVLLHATGRLTAPELSEVSVTRITSGYLTTQQLIQVIDKRGCQVVIVATERFAELLPGLEDWLSENYLLIYDERWQDTYAVKKDTAQTPLTEINREFVNGVLLVGADLVPADIERGKRGYISFYWHVNSKPSKPYKNFVHLRSENGANILQLDRFPFDGTLPVDGWPVGTVVKETITFVVPEGIEANEYTLHVGLYDPDTFQRIPLEGDTSGENAIVLGRMTIR